MAKKTTRKSTAQKLADEEKAQSTKKSEISDSLVKKIIKMRKQGVSWDSIMEDTGLTTSQVVNKVKPRMKELDPNSVRPSYDRSGAPKKKAKKTSAKKSSSKKTTAKAEDKPAKKSSGKKRKPRRVPRTEEA